jgi:hypothetical protein
MKTARDVFKRMAARLVAGLMALVLATAPMAAQGLNHATVHTVMASAPCPHQAGDSQNDVSHKHAGHPAAGLACCHSAPPALATALPVALKAPRLALALVAHSDPPLDGFKPAGPDEPPRYTA